jgi:hypothetical protein
MIYSTHQQQTSSSSAGQQQSQQGSEVTQLRIHYTFQVDPDHQHDPLEAAYDQEETDQGFYLANDSLVSSISSTSVSG